MLLGKPVVCFRNSGGAPEEVGDTGLVVSEFSPRAMAQAIANLASSSEHMSLLGEAARQRVLDNFSCAQQVQKINREISALIRTSPGTTVSMQNEKAVGSRRDFPPAERLSLDGQNLPAAIISARRAGGV